MFWSWPIGPAVILVAVQISIGEKSCVLWSSAGLEVLRGSTFEVYCTFNCKNKLYIYSGSPPQKQSHRVFNDTTIYLKIEHLTSSRTFSCKCEEKPELDPCGQDISTGYPPDRPKDIFCDYEIQNLESGVINCSWNGGRNTFLRNHFELGVRTVSGNGTEGLLLLNVSRKESKRLSVNFNMSRSVDRISVWVRAHNSLGSAVSAVVNYTLSDRAKPSALSLGQPDCSSRECRLKVEQPLNVSYLEIQYRADHQQWTSNPDSVRRWSSSTSSQARSIGSLEPHRLYHFRARSKFRSGLWSSWSSNVSGWTQEEAPARALDVWVVCGPDSKSMMVLWKEPNVSISRGKITQYTVRVSSPSLNIITNVSADSRNYSVPLCSHYEVTMWAHNSKGMSPPATMTSLYTEAKPLRDVRATVNSDSVTISWRKPKLAPAMYVVELYPEDFLLNELQWVRLNKSETTAVLSGIKPYECYEGAVYVFYNKSFVGKTRSNRVAALESKPKSSPSFEAKNKGNKVIITWKMLPRAFRMGCITQYTIYVESSTGDHMNYSVGASETTFEIKNLSPAIYTLWMTASTAKGEGPKSQKGKFPIKQDDHPSLLLECVVAVLMVLLLLCLCQSAVVKHRFWELFRCLMLDVVPDPANSKWAKECIKEKGRLSIQLLSSGSTSTDKEEDVNMVDVEELFKQTIDTPLPTGDSTQLISRSPDVDLNTLMYPALTTYIKSLSHDSDTNTTVDYISSDGPESMEEREDEDVFGGMSFLPSHGIFFTEMLQFDGKLTLDAVKIDCSDMQIT
ncbi:interleukin-12 receptor subunit beta-2 isoform X2 [Oryzias melastigma]|uniref:interleukin-12 receptor subunit beta-2 isoform X2 n=1 Tax=Oryzias melastigma TaxID=30732 RepID=UPI000CF8218D|nr:interleukin-12 receptor subunit beta-2 isoform X2 [Oryzias melastigma]